MPLAFDRLNHNSLLKVLSSSGLGEPLLSWVASYLLNRKQYIKINGTCSDLVDITSDVPQGGHLSPLSYVNDINKILRSCRFLLFADDINLITSGESVVDLDFIAHLEYGVVVRCPSTIVDQYEIERVQRQFLKYVAYVLQIDCQTSRLFAMEALVLLAYCRLFICMFLSLTSRSIKKICFDSFLVKCVKMAIQCVLRDCDGGVRKEVAGRKRTFRILASFAFKGFLYLLWAITNNKLKKKRRNTLEVVLKIINITFKMNLQYSQQQRELHRRLLHLTH
ncbi:Uncharacterized protein FWK35_00008107 [Aphis craccivora]|uniref:Reverse transcriptase domain-containing protein n=1 Tax=Aphis craccivora TaxID=307492 RepID=A0A6G0Z3P3_APHCR|nr:Uncharacterized protein FWK35_00008107 [Aphis craccivora]